MSFKALEELSGKLANLELLAKNKESDEEVNQWLDKCVHEVAAKLDVMVEELETKPDSGKKRRTTVEVTKGFEQTAFFKAVEDNNLQLVDELLALPQVQIDARDSNDMKNTALIKASRRNLKEMCLLLLLHKADIDMINALRETALIIAVKESNKELVKLLLINGAKVNDTDCNGWSALHFACKNNNRSLVKLLCNQDDIHTGLKNFNGDRPGYLTTSESIQDIFADDPFYDGTFD